VSLFSNATYSASEARIPAFTAALKPRLSPKEITRTSGKFRSVKSTEASVEPLSTKIVSKSSNDWRRSEVRQRFRNLSPFQFGTTTCDAGGRWGHFSLKPRSSVLYLARRPRPLWVDEPDRGKRPCLADETP
jgi:hypothetical protein